MSPRGGSEPLNLAYLFVPQLHLVLLVNLYKPRGAGGFSILASGSVWFCNDK